MSEGALSLISGSLAGAASTVAGAPLDFIKTRMQTHGSLYKETNAYMLRTFFAGTRPAVVSSVVENGVVFAANTTLTRMYASATGRSPSDRRFSNREVATIGALSGIVSATAISPAETIKVRLQSNPETWKSASDCLVRTVREEGARSLFKGLPAQMARDVPFTSVFFTSYSWITNTLKTKNQGKPITSFETVMAGGLAGAAGWTVTLPMDIVKTRAQASKSTESLAKLSLKVASKVFEESGIRGFFRGWTIVTLRAFPVNGVTFLVYEASQRSLTESLASRS